MQHAPKEVDPVLMAFPADVIGEYLPAWDDLPAEFRKNWHGGEGACSLASGIFYGTFSAGGKNFNLKDGKIGFVPMDGVDPNMAWRHLQVCLGSYQPKHEHKIAGVGYLISLWIKFFLLDDEVIWSNPSNEDEG